MHERRRQPRGLARMEAILDAAQVVFARDGVERATTNAIAAQAGISPGSLYQYYADKTAIGTALGERYAEGLAATHAAAMVGIDPVASPMADVVERLVTPVVAYKTQHRAFVPVFVGAGTSLPSVAAANTRFERRIIELLKARHPGRDAEVEVAAAVVFALVTGMIPMIGDITDGIEADTAELVTIVTAYLEAKDLG